MRTVCKPEATDAITLWVRDGFSAPEASVLADIRKLSTDDPTLHLFLPKSHADELKSAIASAQAAEETLHFKGNPTSQEGKECRQSMVTKQNAEDLRIEDLIGQILGGARLFLSGGQEQSIMGLKEGVEDAAKQVEMGLDYMENRLGTRPAGMWPGEGSVRPEALEMIRENGIKWAATDEEILAMFSDFEVLAAEREHHRALPVAKSGAKAALYTYGFRPLYNLLPEPLARSLAYKLSVTAIKH